LQLNATSNPKPNPNPKINPNHTPKSEDLNMVVLGFYMPVCLLPM